MKYIKKIIKHILFLKRHVGVKFNTKSNTKLNHKTILEGYNSIGYNSNIINSTLGYGSYIGDNCNLSHTKIGRFCSIASDVNIIIGSHPPHTFVSSHPSFFSLRKQAGFTFVNKDKFKEVNWVNESKNIIIEIGNDIWIGNGVKIIQGITIGNGAIIATGAVVTRNIEPYGVYGGVPAKLIKSRFNSKDVAFLNELRWWNWDLDKIEKYSSSFEDIEKLKKIIAIDGSLNK